MEHPQWLRELLGIRPPKDRNLTSEWAFHPPRNRIRTDNRGVIKFDHRDLRSAIEWEARQSALWAATYNALEEQTGINRKLIAKVLGHRRERPMEWTNYIDARQFDYDAPSSPFRVRLYW